MKDDMEDFLKQSEDGLTELASACYGSHKAVDVYEEVCERSNLLYDHYTLLVGLHTPPDPFGSRGHCKKPLQGLRMLDIGGGSGIETGHFLSAGISRYVCIDMSQHMVDRFNERFSSNDATVAFCMDMREIEISEPCYAGGKPAVQNELPWRSPLEAAFARDAYTNVNLSWSLMYIDNAAMQLLFRKIKGLLSPNLFSGSVVMTVPHPMRGMGLSDPYDYHTQGVRFYDAGEKKGFPTFHRTISDYINIPVAAGFRLEKMVELEVHPDDPFADSVKYPQGSRYPSRLMMRWTMDKTG